MAINKIIEQREQEMKDQLATATDEHGEPIYIDEIEFKKRSKALFMVSKEVVMMAWRKYRPTDEGEKE